MKNILESNYDIEFEQITSVGENYLVNTLTGEYLLMKVEIELKEELIEKLNYSNIPYHLILLTKKQEKYITHNSNDYVLLKVRYNEEIGDIDQLKKCIIPSSKGNCEWDTLWQERVEFHEKQQNEMSNNKYIKYVSQYFIGLTENAIQYLINIKKNEPNIETNISHRKIEYPLNKYYYYNPYNMILDEKGRDFAEYIKHQFFYCESCEDIVELIKQNSNLIGSKNYFFARLLFPSYYYEEYEKYLINDSISKEFENIIKKSNDYASLLNKIKIFLNIKN